MGARSRPPRTERTRSEDQHFLRSDAVALELVRDAGIGRDDHVLEIGAGGGRLTAPLAATAARVTAVEVDPALVDRLRQRFRDQPSVDVMLANILEVPHPDEPWRAFGNVPFSITTPILRWLLDAPATGPTRADLLVQFEAARKRAAPSPLTLLSAGWMPWWEFTLSRRVPRLAFDPPPSVDAGLLVVSRRARPWLPPGLRPAYVAMLRRAFDHGSRPVRRSLAGRVSPQMWKRFARERGISFDVLPPHLDARDWVALFRMTDDASHNHPASERSRRTRSRGAPQRAG